VTANGPTQPSWATKQVGGYPGYTGHDANMSRRQPLTRSISGFESDAIQLRLAAPQQTTPWANMDLAVPCLAEHDG
jgi:hypothetical protein